MIGEPPSNAGAVQETWACAFPAIAKGLSGAVGTVLGVTAEEAKLDTEIPMAFVAITVNVYKVPFERPGTVVDSPEVVIDILPGIDVTV